MSTEAGAVTLDGMTGDRLRTAIRTAQYAMRYAVNAHPWLYLPLAKRLHPDYENRFIEPDTELVIEGFGRSGSTFAVLAFESAQPGEVKTAHHTHAAAQVLVAASRGIPTLVIVRRPLEAALAHMVRRRIPARPALKSWIRYHERILPYLDRVVATPLECVSTDFGGVTRAINERFGTSFGVFEHTPENEVRLFELIEADNMRKYGSPTDWVARPTKERLERKEARRAELRAPDLALLRERADRAYETLLPGRGDPPPCGS